MMPMKNNHPIVKIVTGSLWDLPSPSSLNVYWNWGSLLGLCLSTQILSGVFLALHYSSDLSLAFDSVMHISRDVNLGWGLRFIHANGASFFFMCLYIHISRGIYFNLYHQTMVWLSGVTMLLATMATSFLGYVLPWGQMSFWGATVITNLFSAIPVIGGDIVFWLWGGFSVGGATLSRFFVFHFLLPFIILALTLIHLLFLHQKGSMNPLGLSQSSDKIPFQPYFILKDAKGFILIMLILLYLSFQAPWMLGDPENFIPANSLVTPKHIQPEWYFLFAYAILRAIPNKLGGVVALFMSVLILYLLPFYNNDKYSSSIFSPVKKIMFWLFVCVVLLLTWVGARPVDKPFIVISQILTVVYFLYFLVFPYMK